MRVIPRVVVHNGCSICHTSYLVTVIPPRHYSGTVFSVLVQPAVCFSKIVQDITRTGKKNMKFDKKIFNFIKIYFS